MLSQTNKRWRSRREWERNYYGNPMALKNVTTTIGRRIHWGKYFWTLFWGLKYFKVISEPFRDF